MEKTIKERAYEAVGKPLPKEGEMYVPHMLKVEESTFVNGYIKGAKEQREIDIVKVCRFLEREYAYNGSLAVIDDLLIEDLCKALEE